MRRWIFIILIVACTAAAHNYDYSATEIKSIDYHLNESFYIIKRHFNAAINGVNKPPKIYESRGFHSFTYLLNSIQNFTVLSKGKQTTIPTKTKIVFFFSEVFTFNISAQYIVNFGILPVSGDCLLRLTYENASYTMNIQNLSITPSIEGEYALEVISISNSVGARMGVKQLLQNKTKTILARKFNDYIIHCFKNDVTQFYVDYFANTNYYTYFPFLRNTTINVRHKLAELIAGNRNNVSTITAFYNRNFASLEDTPALPEESYDELPDLDCMKSVDLTINEVLRVLTTEIRVLKNITLRQNRLPVDGDFKLDTRSFARVFPELLYDSNDNSGTLTFNGHKTNIEGNFSSERASLFISNAIISITAYLPFIKTHLFKITLNLSGEFTPRFYQRENDKKRLFMGLTAKEVNFEILSTEKGWDNQYAMINRKGLHKFIYDMINSYFIKHYGNETIGSGILISYSLPAKVKKYEMTKTSMVIILDAV